MLGWVRVNKWRGGGEKVGQERIYFEKSGGEGKKCGWGRWKGDDEVWKKR